MTSSGFLVIPPGERERGQGLGQDAEALADALFHDNPRAMLVYDSASQQVLMVNQAALLLYGYDEAEFLGLTTHDLRPPEERERYNHMLAGAPETPLRTRNWRHVRKDGTFLTVDVTGRPCLFRGRPCRIASLDPVVQGRDRADALHAMELAIRSMSDGVIVTDAVGLPGEGPLVRLVNPAFERQSGRTSVDIIGRPVAELLQSDDGAAAERIRNAFRTGTPCSVELVGTHLDGGPYRRHLHVQPARDSDGALTGFIITGRDVTRLRSMQARALHDQKMAAIGRLAGGVAHTFNNLLTSILGYAEMAQSNLTPTEPLFRDIAEIVKAAQRAAAVTEQLLALGGRQLLRPRVLDLNATLRGLADRMAAEAGPLVRVRLELGWDPGSVLMDPEQLEQVVLRLCRNARDTMPDGGTLHVATAPGPDGVADSAAVDKPSHVVLTFEDSAAALDSETVNHLFDPFFCPAHAPRRDGLALATVHGILVQSGGQIEVENAPGIGTLFRILLPKAEPVDAVPLRPNDKTAKPPKGHETVLLAEDETVLRRLAADILRKLGYKVLEAANGAEAWQTAQSYDAGGIDLLVTDVMMPEVNGRELAERFSALHPHAPVLFMSGYAKDLLDGYDNPSSGLAFLQKPYSLDALARHVRELLDRQQAADGQASN